MKNPGKKIKQWTFD